MTVVWIVAGAAVVAALARRVVWPYEQGESHLGFVSQQWLAERRVSDMADPQR
jgi:hypothetical protein